jgi:hypothetical protein
VKKYLVRDPDGNPIGTLMADPSAVISRKGIVLFVHEPPKRIPAYIDFVSEERLRPVSVYFESVPFNWAHGGKRASGYELMFSGKKSDAKKAGMRII